MKSDLLSIRATEPEDLGAMFLFENNMDVWLYSETTRPYSKFTLSEYLKNAHDDIYTSKQLRLIIEKNELDGTRKVIGFIDLYDFDPTHRRAGIGILIGDENERRKGFATDALKLLISYAFETLNLHQLYCMVEESNKHSIRLFNKAGFTESGRLNEWLLHKGTWHPVLMMQLISRIS